MKREFLLTLNQNGEPLSKEVVDAIMAEHGKDIERLKGKFSDYDTLKEKAAMADSSQDWEKKFREAESSHENQVKELRFRHQLEKEVHRLGGRNQKAIEALLDLDALREDPSAVEQALLQVKSTCGYLFSEEEKAPSLAWGAGNTGNFPAPQTLAGALKERFERN